MKLNDINTTTFVGLIKCGSSEGSGFIAKYKNEYYMITDYHVVFNEDNMIYDSFVSIAFHTQTTSFNSFNSLNIDDIRQCVVYSSERDNEDLVIIKVTDIEDIANRTIPIPEISLEETSIDTLWGCDVCLLGQPLSLERQLPFRFKPFLSRGIVSSYDISEGLFVVDSPSYYGNSGGVVLVVDQDANIRIVGIVQNLVMFILKWQNMREQNLRREDWNNSGYTICRSVNRIIQLIENGYATDFEKPQIQPSY